MSQAQLRLVAGNPAANTVGKMRTNPQPTSKIAALAAYPKSGSQRANVLDEIVGAGSVGMIDAELQRALAMNPSTERPRRIELVEGGWVCDSGRKRAGAGAGQSIVWVLSPTGRARLAIMAGVIAGSIP